MNNEAIQLVIAVSEAILALAVLGGGLLALVKGRAAYQHAVNSMSERLGRMEEQLAAQTEILSRLAAGEERMNGLDRRVEMLEDRDIEIKRRLKRSIAEGMATAAP